MDIIELFEEIQNKFTNEKLKGEFILHGNCIIWEYNFESDNKEIEIVDDDIQIIDNEDEEFDFESTSSDEMPWEVYVENLEMIKNLLDELEETDKWSFSNPDIIENKITFKIF